MTRPFTELDALEGHISPEQAKIQDRAERTANENFKPDEETKAVMVGNEIRAGYKIQVFFGPNRSVLNPYRAIISIFSSGKFFHGGGDDRLLFCLDAKEANKFDFTSMWKWYMDTIDTTVRQKEHTQHGCGHPIPSSNIKGEIALCPKCQVPSQRSRLVEYIGFEGTTGDLVALVKRIFDMLKGNADIYCKYDRTDIRYLEMEKHQGVEKAHRLRGMFIYPLKNIIADTSNGASLDGRLMALFNA